MRSPSFGLIWPLWHLPVVHSVASFLLRLAAPSPSCASIPLLSSSFFPFLLSLASVREHHRTFLSRQPREIVTLSRLDLFSQSISGSFYPTLSLTGPDAGATFRFLGLITELLFDAPRNRGHVAPKVWPIAFVKIRKFCNVPEFN
jgi:hypothetical protein